MPLLSAPELPRRSTDLSCASSSARRSSSPRLLGPTAGFGPEEKTVPHDRTYSPGLDPTTGSGLQEADDDHEDRQAEEAVNPAAMLHRP